jgi:hypothetical protein
MNLRTAYIRRSRKGLRLQKRALAVALLGVAACTGLLVQGWHATLQNGARDATPAATAAAAAAGPAVAAAAMPSGPRRIYPYSVVAGGVSGRAELAHIIQTDKVVAAHYAAFEVARAHPVTVTKARAVHVSYRKGDQVYWTANKVMLAEGETLLSDGKNEIRGRCGNRISEVAMLPVEAAAPGEELDAAVDDAGDGSALQVAAQFGADGAGRHSHQLLSYPNGAGLLAVTGGEGWRAPGSPFGSGVSAPAYPGYSYGTPVALTGGGAQVNTGAPAPAAGTASGGGSTSETPHGSTPGSTSGSTPIDTASSGGSTSETPRGGSVAAPAPADGGTGGVPAGGSAPPVGLPGDLADTVQPEPGPAVEAPALPGTVLSPVELPTVPVQTVETTAEAPEPATLWLSGVGMAALLLLRRRRGCRA